MRKNPVTAIFPGKKSIAPFGSTPVFAPSCGLYPGHGLTFGRLEKQKGNCFVSLLPDSSPPDGWLRHGLSCSWSMISLQALSTFLPFFFLFSPLMQELRLMR